MNYAVVTKSITEITVYLPAKIMGTTVCVS